MVSDGYLAAVIHLGQWVPCTGNLLMIYGLSCSALPRRERMGLNGATHDHYLVCGCRWEYVVRKKYCKKHPRRVWEP